MESSVEDSLVASIRAYAEQASQSRTLLSGSHGGCEVLYVLEGSGAAQLQIVVKTLAEQMRWHYPNKSGGGTRGNGEAFVLCSKRRLVVTPTTTSSHLHHG